MNTAISSTYLTSAPSARSTRRICLRHRMALGAIGFLFASVAVLPDASALWRRNRDVSLNSAYTLNSGDFVVGVFTPLQYGLLDSLTLVLHPVFELILTPNIGLRWNVYDGPVSVTLSGGYLQTFLTERSSELGGGFPGSAESAVLVTTSVTDSAALTMFVGYTLDFATITSREEVLRTPAAAGGDSEFEVRRTRDALSTSVTSQGILYGAGLNWRFGNSHLLSLQYRGVARITDSTHETPTVTAMYAHAWTRTRLGVGVAAGRFLFRTGEQELVELPVYPVIDLWFRL